MGQFSWLGDGGVPPEKWDLRRLGWQLKGELSGLHPLLCDSDSLPHGQFLDRTLVTDVSSTEERTRLMSMGVADALSPSTELEEVAVRISRQIISNSKIPRLRRIGPLVLDFFHRDARCGNKWLSLRPREYELLWRLAEASGGRVSREELLRDVWRINHDPGTNRVEVHVSRLRSRLGFFGQEDMICTHPDGGYSLLGDGALSFEQGGLKGDVLSNDANLGLAANG